MDEGDNFDLDQFIVDFQEQQSQVTDETEALALSSLASLQPIPVEDLLTRVTAKSLLTTRDQNVESFLRELTEEASVGGAEDNTAVELLDKADEQAFLALAQDRLAEASPLLCHKYWQVLKALLSHKQQ